MNRRLRHLPSGFYRRIRIGHCCQWRRNNCWASRLRLHCGNYAIGMDALFNQSPCRRLSVWQDGCSIRHRLRFRRDYYGHWLGKVIWRMKYVYCYRHIGGYVQGYRGCPDPNGALLLNRRLRNNMLLLRCNLLLRRLCQNWLLYRHNSLLLRQRLCKNRLLLYSLSGSLLLRHGLLLRQWLCKNRLLYSLSGGLLLLLRLGLLLRKSLQVAVRLSGNRLDNYRRGAGNNHAQVLGGCPGNIDYSPFHKRPAVVYPNRNLPVVVSVGNDYERPKRQGGMGSSEQGGIENFPRGCRPSLELGSVPRSNPFLSENLPRRSRKRLGCRVLWYEQGNGNAESKYGTISTLHIGYYRHSWEVYSQVS